MAGRVAALANEGRALRAQGNDGLVWSSVRMPDGQCIGIFWPDVIPGPVQGRHYSYHWDADTKKFFADSRRFEFHTYGKETQLWWNYLRSGERKFYDEVNEENFHRIERRFGSFQRLVSLPSQVEADKVEASFDKGVLTVSIPKAEQAKPRRVEIKATS